MTTAPDPKPQAERLYGRQRGHPLRARQLRLMDETLPRMRFPLDRAADPRSAFGETPPEDVWLEVGFGGGEHSLAQHESHPDVGYIACEVFENGLSSLLSRVVPEGGEATAPVPDRLRIWDEDARVLLRALPDNSLGRAFLMFPDPWPKARHAKRRFVHPGNIAQMARVLRPGAEWRVASDHPVYQAWVTEMMAAQDVFDVAPPATVRPEGWPATRYEAKAFREGRQPFYWVFTRRG
ncbi:tRNA (guanine-N7)-methyltransferase [Ameyamaea chiangmaiensis NBRC 103196]|uniref:tRNA (guanine-N(7)-)-methyltransferase n=1 Tax=Ameyamaea chiangmaiensis TaxID=442969 RepID=A0A850PFM0_9PROT|nr:tRNA (guanine(46)-N(7))-methyltransferase TrmB [Ameyamaea chiangmaiensis]MBS4075299.1 tRNA (guanosine(46)-N7)-methyltransferase TrmB [Ameyamaea chiangmaiensis]NVN41036.1 tRNA (guanosine(46)-N7)-methyltransferase TrmB [Ameyamaea chiangmaiensis]GBQ66687.1 tRNA (guanine-N7)-methyltransferase [Ameyamaea chiangmaiensis NBRC 103196]